MTITIKKVRNYVLLGTIISASATTPAQAGSLKNLNSNDDVTKTPDNQASTDSKDVLLETQMCKEADSCISFPEFDSYDKLKKNDNTNSIDNSFLKKARQITQSVEAAKNVEVKNLADGRKAIIYKTAFPPLENPELYTFTYSPASERERVPEPSALLGLITFFLLAAKRQTAKNNQILVE
ncbi:MAG: hypothetical protein WBA07_18605 [Rivularia sp. (in: cyanobacteria)]